MLPWARWAGRQPQLPPSRAPRESSSSPIACSKTMSPSASPVKTEARETMVVLVAEALAWAARFTRMGLSSLFGDASSPRMWPAVETAETEMAIAERRRPGVMAVLRMAVWAAGLGKLAGVAARAVAAAAAQDLCLRAIQAVLEASAAAAAP